MATKGWENVRASDLPRNGSVPAARQKYRNIRLQTPDGAFDSKKEYQHWLRLKGELSAGVIQSLQRQHRFTLYAPTQMRQNVLESVGDYVADFSYVDRKGHLHVVDVKGGSATKTPLYRWKKRHFEIQEGLAIEEV